MSLQLRECFDAIGQYVVVTAPLLRIWKRAQMVAFFKARVLAGVMNGVTPLLTAQGHVAEQLKDASFERDVLLVEHPA